MALALASTPLTSFLVIYSFIMLLRHIKWFIPILSFNRFMVLSEFTLSCNVILQQVQLHILPVSKSQGKARRGRNAEDSPPQILIYYVKRLLTLITVTGRRPSRLWSLRAEWANELMKVHWLGKDKMPEFSTHLECCKVGLCALISKAILLFTERLMNRMGSQSCCFLWSKSMINWNILLPI